MLDVRIVGLKETNAAIVMFTEELWRKGHMAVRMATKMTAEDIKRRYRGDPLGFRDRTGALRQSIVGDYLETKNNEIVGHISAGDDRIGSEGLPTRAYASTVEFSEFRNLSWRNTAYLRPGVEQNISNIKKIVESTMSPKRLGVIL